MSDLMISERLINELQTRTQETSAALDPAARDAELVEALADYGPEGKWRYAPPSARRAAEQAVRADQRKRAQAAADSLARTVKEAETLEAAAIEAARRPMDAETAWDKRAGMAGLSAGNALLLDVRQRLQTAELRADLPTMTPADLYHRYEAALADPTRQDHATLIQFVEGLRNWRPVMPSGQDVAIAVDAWKLQQRIERAKRERVPAVWQAVGAALGEARRALRLATQGGGLTPVAVRVEADE